MTHLEFIAGFEVFLVQPSRARRLGLWPSRKPDPHYPSHGKAAVGVVGPGWGAASTGPQRQGGQTHRRRLKCAP